MADEPTPLVLAAEKPSEPVIKALRHWLVMAKSGELHAVIILGVTGAGGHRRSSAGSMGYANAVYLAELTKRDALNDAQRGEESFDPGELTDDDE